MKRFLIIIGSIVLGIIVIVFVYGFIVARDSDRHAGLYAPNGCSLHLLTLNPRDIPARMGKYVAEIQKNSKAGYAASEIKEKLSSQVLQSAGKPIDYYAKRLINMENNSKIFMGVVSFSSDDEALGEWLSSRSRYQGLLSNPSTSKDYEDVASQFGSFTDLGAENAYVDMGRLESTDGQSWDVFLHDSNVFVIITFRLPTATTIEDLHDLMKSWKKRASDYKTTRGSLPLCDTTGRT